MQTLGAAHLPRPRSPEPWCLPLLPLLPGWPALAPSPGGSKFGICCGGRCCSEYCCGGYCCKLAGLWDVKLPERPRPRPL